MSTETTASTTISADRILDQAADALIFADRQGLIGRWNRAAAELFGYPAEQALGRNLDLIIPPPLRPAHWRGFDAAMAQGHTRLGGRPTLTRAQHACGRRLYVEMSFALVCDDAGVPLGSVAVARDVTARVEREKAAAAAAGAATREP
ncbi:MAG: PAS domain S-box protein [Rubrivivax sp.]